MPTIWRMAHYMNGYINGANTEPELKMIIAPRTNSKMISGTIHHFFSWRRKRKNSLASCHILSCLLDAIQVRSGPQIESVADGGRRSHKAAWQSILADLGELAACLYQSGFAFFAAEVNVAFCINRRGGIIATNAFAPNVGAASCIDARGDAAVVDAIQQIVNEQQGWLFR